MKRKPITPDPESVMQSLREVGLELIPCPEHPEGLTVIDENGNEQILPSDFNIFNSPPYQSPASLSERFVKFAEKMGFSVRFTDDPSKRLDFESLFPDLVIPKKEDKTMIIVKVRHSDNGQEFMFRTPTQLTAGTAVLVETKRGKQPGMVSADSIEISEELFNYIVSPYTNGNPPQLRNVLGRYHFTEFLTTSEQ